MADPLIDRFRNAFVALFNEIFPERKYLGFHRYTVTACDFDKQTFDGQPSVSKYGLPGISSVPIRSSLQLELKPGTSVLVGFASADPADPYIANLDQLTLLGKLNVRADSTINIGETASIPAARQGDMVLIPSVGLSIMFAVNPAGDTGAPPPSQMMTMTPYFVSLSTVPVPPAFPPVGSWSGITSTGSPLVNLP